MIILPLVGKSRHINDLDFRSTLMYNVFNFGPDPITRNVNEEAAYLVFN